MSEGRRFVLFGALSFSFLLESLQLAAVVIITKNNNSLMFDSADSSFTPKAPTTGIFGTIANGNPRNGCAPLVNISTAPEGVPESVFALMFRGSCPFDTKVRHAQEAGFKAAVIADTMESLELITMAGNKRGIEIPAVFISKMAGEVLTQFTNDSNAECCILPAYEYTAWLVMVVSFIFLIVVTAVFAICLWLRQHRSNQFRGRRVLKSQGIGHQTVKCLPTIIYDLRYERGGSFDVCAVCLEDYADGAVLRILPCSHRFHCSCIDAWLTNWQAFCPVCKRDVNKATSSTESTPLLSESITSSQQQEGSPLTQEAHLPVSANRHAEEGCRFAFNRPPLQSSGTPIMGLRQTRNRSLNSLTDQDSVEAFRASPYFTPPSFFHRSAPNVVSLLNSTSGDARDNDSLDNPNHRELQFP